jgi:diguanylate cyclase (GGDEF)-like protein
MSGAEGVLAVNVGVAALFAAGYAIFALTNRAHRVALGFSVNYLIGMLSPLNDLIAPAVGAPAVTEWLSYVTFLLAMLSVAVTFSLFHRRTPSWGAAVAIFVLGLTLRATIGIEPRDTLAYGLAYQLPFALAAIQVVSTVLAVNRRPLHLALAGVFVLMAANFLLKAFMAVSFGAGRTLTSYTSTTYAMLSQSSSGILLLAAGLLMLLIVAQKAILESQQASETDPLSGLSNRRGFDREAHQAITRALAARRPLAVAVFDLDHFKRINDSFGHAVGDSVIVAFAARLRALAPPGALVGRMGGEEFVLMLENTGAEAMWLCADAIRRRACAGDGLPHVTVSGGVAELRPGESLAELMRRADQASYQAKGGGRDQVRQAPEDRGPGGRGCGTSGVVVALRRPVQRHPEQPAEA